MRSEPKEFSIADYVKRKEASYQHDYSFDEWRQWNGENYVKIWYDVLLSCGMIVKGCWPNAGLLIDTSTGRQWSAADNVQVRISRTLPPLVWD